VKRIGPSGRAYGALAAADGISRLGDVMTAVVIPWFVLETTGSAGRTGVVVFAIAVAVVISLFLGGTIVDRLGFRSISLAGDLASGATVASIAVLHQFDALPFELLVALVFLGTLLDLPAQMARYAVLPEVAGEAGLRIERAMGISEGIITTGALVGPAIAGLLIAGIGPANVLWVDVATFGVSFLLVAFFVPGRTAHAQAAAESFRRTFADGWRFLRNDRVLLALVIYLFAMNLVIGPVEVLVVPLYASIVLDSAIALGLMTAAIAVGGLAGNLIFGATGHRFPRRPTFVASFLAIPLGLVALSGGPALWLALPVMAGIGLGLSLGNMIEYTVYFERIPEHLRARVLGITGGLTWLSVPLGRGAAGFIFETWDFERSLLVIGLVVLPLPFLVLAVGSLGGGERAVNP
jgi:MFS family permease